mgnify:CR=1 FL=1
MAFPYLQQWVYDRSARSIADKFDQWRQEQVETADDTGERIPYLQELYAAMQAYNLDLYKKRPKKVFEMLGATRNPALI